MLLEQEKALMARRRNTIFSKVENFASKVVERELKKRENAKKEEEEKK